jgi:hypothetical protein
VDGRALAFERRRLHLVQRRLTRFEFFALLDELLGVVELPAQLVRPRVRSLVTQIASIPAAPSAPAIQAARFLTGPMLLFCGFLPRRRAVSPEAAPAGKADSDRGKE